ncbi:ABC transporter ATP-binding protein [Glaciihabitans sp. INWT7]|uniref:ABC transporter ATP-binding protein n=1 Tax=Glaciihabitans sp. INWT7 TaxID=2596912 RepID=UPI001623F68E|nr:ABC transporter ATP-binding protein [Glaciihabitans sp. INWT7]QNE45982.1 ABC transporter ATP-binding protein [Glaciihabitans sp. INWT7]
MSLPTIVNVSGVSKKFTLNRHKSIKERLVNSAVEKKFREDFWALRDIDLDIKAGSTLGLVGHNGSGKSTLLKVIGGIIEPTTGKVERRGRMAALLELGAGFHPDLTGRENVYLNAAILGLNQREIDRYFDAIVDFSGIEDFIDTQVKFFSSGMYVRLAFAVAVHVDPDLLLVDEVLAVGDEPFQNKCVAKIAEFQKEGRTIVVVSHSAAQIELLADRVVVMNHGEMIFDGKTEDGIRVLQGGYEAQRLHEESLHAADSAPATRVTSVLIASAEPEDEKVVVSGADMTVSFGYEILEPEEPIIANLTIETPQGALVYGFSTRMLDSEIPHTVGRHQVDFTFTDPALGTGTYILRGGLETLAGEQLHQLSPASTFTVSSASLGTGYLRMDLSTHVYSLPPV